MQVKVLMLAFEDDGVVRMVEVPDSDLPLHIQGVDPHFFENHVLEKVFYYGQNDFAVGPEKNTTCSVSAGDVVEFEDRFFLCAMAGWKEINETQLEEYKSLPRRDRHFCGLMS